MKKNPFEVAILYGQIAEWFVGAPIEIPFHDLCVLRALIESIPYFKERLDNECPPDDLLTKRAKELAAIVEDAQDDYDEIKLLIAELNSHLPETKLHPEQFHVVPITEKWIAGIVGFIDVDTGRGREEPIHVPRTDASASSPAEAIASAFRNAFAGIYREDDRFEVFGIRSYSTLTWISEHGVYTQAKEE